ncbi:MAG: PD-(D/E)XK nuclease family protein [Actinomycetia bacterium]|nr:PD-(D/E)XK nuclease family protein [Actinomycetes bacterium]
MNEKVKIEWTPFDLSGLAGSEKFHTGMFSWIFSGGCTGLRKGANYRILSKLTGQNINGEIVCIPESSPFDLLIRSNRFLIVVENKLSSATRYGQIQRYTELILSDVKEEPKREQKKSERRPYDKNLQDFKGDREAIGILLSLAGEKLTSTEGREYSDDCTYQTCKGKMIWLAVSYYELLEMLSDEANNMDSILQAYLRSLEYLCILHNTFLENHTNYPCVFKNANLKKTVKNPPNSECKSYITRNNLETGFQIALLRKILYQVMNKLNRDGISFQRTYVGETKGTGNFGVSLMEIPKDKEFLGFCFKEDFYIGFQYQGDALKVTFSRWEYDKSINKDFSDDENERNAFFERFKEVCTDTEVLGYRNLNKPRSKAYVSVSLNMDPNTKRCKREGLPERLQDKLILRESRKEDFVSLIVEECRLISEICKQVMKGEISKL